MTAFLIESDGDAILCFGDTGPDEVQKGSNIRNIWKSVANKVKQQKLKAIILDPCTLVTAPITCCLGR